MRLFLLTALSILISTQAFAGPQTPDGFSGFLDAGFFVKRSNDALSANSANEDIDTLNEHPDTFSEGIFAVLFEVKYKKDSIIYHAGTPVQGDDPQLEFGVTKLLGQSSLGAALVVNPIAKEWEDPYIADRDETESYSAGVKLKYDGVAGSPFALRLKVIGVDVHDDKLGKRYSSMKRDGYTAEFSTIYRYKGDGFMAEPSLLLKSDRREGDAESSKGAGVKILFIKPSQKYVLIAGAGVTHDSFDETSPVFGKTREETKSGAFITYKLNNIFGLERKHISLTAGAAHKESNINFYDATTYFGGVTFGIDF